jgi:hypothetical protein
MIRKRSYGLRKMSPLLIAFLALALGLGAVVAQSSEEQPAVESTPEIPIPEVKTTATELHAVPPPPFSEDIFPCSECHAEMETNLKRREMEDFHDEIELKHGTRDRWCFDCHNPENRDMLRLASGKLVPYTESYNLCGQCHGDKLRDWNVGVHGKRTGKWDGKKQYLLCAHCHNPHAPAFAPIKPMPAPPRPENLR